MVWTPHSTVATIVEKDGLFLMVQEKDRQQIVFNQPAGHLEEGETLIEAARRETLEETAWEVDITHFLGLYIYCSPHNKITYFRHCFIGKAVKDSEQALDPDILQAQWLSKEEILAPDFRARSPLVGKVLEDYLKGKRYPLNIIYQHLPESH